MISIPGSSQSDWVERLTSSGAEQEDALACLRVIILRGLHGSLGYRGADEAFCADVAQESLTKILEKLHMFEGRSKFTTWAVKIAVRLGISKFRKQKFRKISLEAVAGDGLTIDFTATPPEDSKKRFLKAAILLKLQELIDQDLNYKQQTVIRALLEGMPAEEIASRTNSNRNAVYKLFHDARMKLKRGFQSADIFSSDVKDAFETT